jgi:hypothetical protein
MGLSRGWGDLYAAGTAYQYIDITNLTSGRFRLQATADKHTKHRQNGWFKESNETNNSTWANVQLSGGKVTVLRYGPSAHPISS